ncbi:MAG: 4Fe-4S binding protein [Actinomycetota bacterium]
MASGPIPGKPPGRPVPVPFATVRIDDRCTACGNCIITCGPRALRRAPRKPLVVDDACTACGECIEVCPVDAIIEHGATR